MSTTPEGLSRGGADLWNRITEVHDLDVAQEVTLLEACRAKDRLDKLDALLRGDVETWCHVDLPDAGDPTLVINSALREANTTANLMKQLIAALRLPDEATGKKPQRRGPRGAQKPSIPGGKVSSLERARAAKAGA
ncbi:hypothetical protein GCM10010401_07280 [Rarobacter faecitabidus]|uniref:Terminase small subunit n=1 Tax=Rarobacter faecitabidus TaxID=13243 RepID=A0A542Z870_RARFA|nr:hypothetical protein [Rarobacter faecitabidus]TQL56532.1 hypothetical protein FB461_2421 [Rarobacter faecitabidus]